MIRPRPNGGQRSVAGPRSDLDLRNIAVMPRTGRGLSDVETLVRKTGVVLAALAAVVAGPGSVATAAGDEVTELRAYVVTGGKPRGVIEGQPWESYAMLRDAAGRRIGDVGIACVVEKARDKRVLAECRHTLRVDGKGMLLMVGTHHYRDQTVMPGTADPMRHIITGGTGDFAHASGMSDLSEVIGGYTYKFGALG